MAITTRETAGAGVTSKGSPLTNAEVDQNFIELIGPVAEILESKAVTAVDVFVYDTSRDSDGGAWRKRTQHTSWYNETLNTSTRGSRREFPAVAVIVAESNKVTIYDGDDPSLPMWMVFNAGGSGSNWNFIINGNLTGCSAQNGKLCLTAIGNALIEIDFLKDAAQQRYGAGLLFWADPISERNATPLRLDGANASAAIVNSNVNDVAMTVLPNAPIDQATGLPIPTIAVATNGGVSVIKDDGTVVDLTFSIGGFYSRAVTFTGDNKVALVADDNVTTTLNRAIFVHEIPASDFALAPYVFSRGGADEKYIKAVGGAWTGDLIGLEGDIRKLAAVGTDLFAGNTIIKRDPVTPTKGLIAINMPTYNTGYQNGDIKGAFLSDTDDTNVTGSELNTDPNFDSGVGIFLAETGTLTHSSGTITSTKNSTGGSAMTSSAVLTVGKAYYIEFEITATSPAYTHIDSPIGEITSGQVGTHSGTFVATRTEVKFGQNNGGTTSSVTFTRISIRLAEEDRSVNGNGLQVFGTVTKSAVATGADLVAYSGFSASNYLEQAYNSDLDFGTGDFCVMGWVNQTDFTSNEGILRRNYSPSEAGRWSVLTTDTGNIRFGIESAAGDNLFEASAPSSVWFHFCVARNGSSITLYVDGEAKVTKTNTTSLTGANPHFLRVGKLDTGTPFANGSLALLRISATAPTAAQIKKIYEDEKYLFQEGAQATLYGASDAVTALAHDPVTDLLHVGTSAGRSVFQGLRRVDNTTDAVGTAISASNGLVAEE